MYKLQSLTILILLNFFISCNYETRIPIYNIPIGYIGKIQINFNVENGYEPIYSEKFVTYNIPKTGLLNTESHDFVRLSHVDPIFYYVDSNGNRIKQLPFDLVPFTLNDENELRVFYHSHEVDEYDFYNTFEVYIIDSTKNLPKYPRVHRAIKRIDSLFNNE